MRTRRLVIAGGMFPAATIAFVIRKRLSQYPGEDTWAMKAAVLSGLAAILLLLWGQALKRKAQGK